MPQTQVELAPPEKDLQTRFQLLIKDVRSKPGAALTYRKEERRDYMLSDAWNDTFPPDGYDPVYRRFESLAKGPNHDNQRAKNEYLKSKKTRVATFFGVANYMPVEGSQSWKNILKQFLNLPDKKYQWKDAAWLWAWVLLVTIPSVAFRLAFKVIPTILLNTVKLVFEWPLTLLRNFCFYKALTAETSRGKNLAIAGYAISCFFLFLVRAVTSPGKNTRSAIKFGWELGNRGKAGTALAVAFGALSVLTSIAICTIIFPLGIKFLVAHGLPWAGAHLGAVGKGLSFLGYKAVSLGSMLANSTAAVGVGNFIVHSLAPVVKAVGLQTFSAPVLGLAALVSIAIPTVGSLLSRLKDKAVNLIHKKVTEAVNEIPMNDFNKSSAWAARNQVESGIVQVDSEGNQKLRQPQPKIVLVANPDIIMSKAPKPVPSISYDFGFSRLFGKEVTEPKLLDSGAQSQKTSSWGLFGRARLVPTKPTQKIKKEDPKP